MSAVVFSSFLLLVLITAVAYAQECRDTSASCTDWAGTGQCQSSEWVADHCKFSCHKCGENIPKAYDLSLLSADMRSIGFLIGRWRSEFGGKAKFPTIPVFTYGEQLDFTVSERPVFGVSSINYTAFAWGVNNVDALHSEYGVLHVRTGSNHVYLTTVMNNGFTTVEEGEVNGNTISLKLVDIGRISWSRDLPVLDIRREWTLVDPQTLDHRLIMQTLTNVLQEHTYIRYKKILP